MGKLAPGTYSTYSVLIVQLVLAPIVPFSLSLSLFLYCIKHYVMSVPKFTANMYIMYIITFGVQSYEQLTVDNINIHTDRQSG